MEVSDWALTTFHRESCLLWKAKVQPLHSVKEKQAREAVQWMTLRFRNKLIDIWALIDKMNRGALRTRKARDCLQLSGKAPTAFVLNAGIYTTPNEDVEEIVTLNKLDDH